MKKILLFLLPLLALPIGIGAGAVLRPEDHEAAQTGHATEGEAEAGEETEGEDPADAPEYVKLTNQFVVPILSGGEVVSLVILSLSIEVQPGHGEEIYAREPKLRDAFLQVLFDHANAGGFSGDFTEGAALAPLRQALREAAFAVLGPMVTDVLIADIVRQDG